MTREDLLGIIERSDYCPRKPCGLPEAEGNTGECCKKCAEEALADYECNIKTRRITKETACEVLVDSFVLVCLNCFFDDYRDNGHNEIEDYCDNVCEKRRAFDMAIKSLRGAI